MTPQEQDMLNDLVRKINSAAVQDKDSDAERLLRDGLGRNPDSLYILAQTVLVQNIALEQAKRQMSALQQTPSKPTSFLGSLFGHNDPQPQAAPPPPQQSYQTVQYGQPTGQFSQPGPGSGQGFGPSAGGQPSFLRSAATTAAGVAAGALAFQGVESLLHGGGGGFGGFGGGGFGGGDFGGGAPREEIVNNYYGDSGDQGQGGSDAGAQDTSSGDDFSDGGGDFGGDDSSFS